MLDTVNRKVFFYRIRSENLNDPDDRTHVFDAANACDQIAKLHFKVKRDRYHFFGDGDSVAVAPKMDKSRPKMVLFKTRRSGWPEFEDEGIFAPISSDDGKEGKGIAEKTHITFFENGVVGAEFNFHGPRIRGGDPGKLKAAETCQELQWRLKSSSRNVFQPHPDPGTTSHDSVAGIPDALGHRGTANLTFTGRLACIKRPAVQFA